MPKWQLPVKDIAKDRKKYVREYSGVSFNAVDHPFGYWLSEMYYTETRKKSGGAEEIEHVLLRAYNAGLMDDIKDIDAVAKRAFGDLRTPVKRAPRKARKAKKPANIALEGTA